MPNVSESDYVHVIYGHRYRVLYWHVILVLPNYVIIIMIKSVTTAVWSVQLVIRMTTCYICISFVTNKAHHFQLWGKTRAAGMVQVLQPHLQIPMNCWATTRFKIIPEITATCKSMIPFISLTIDWIIQ